MSWTKLGDEWPDAARDLTDAAYRTHVDALCWSNRRGLDLLIPKRDVRRFAETDDPDTAIKTLVAANWWQDRGDAWFIGVQFPDWQLEASVVARRREQSALTTRRSRLHQAGDHSLCLAKNCAHLRGLTAGDASRDSSPDASRERSPGTGRDGAGRDGTDTDEQAESEGDWPPLSPIPNGDDGEGLSEQERALRAVQERVRLRAEGAG